MTVRQPRFVLQANGVPMPGTASFEVDTNSHYAADTFRATIALSKNPPAYQAAWWSTQAKVLIEIFAGLPANPDAFSASDLQSIFYGNVDELEFHAGSNVVEISGRDLTGEMIDTKTSEKYANLTASAIAEKIAGAHGLTPVVTSTSTKVGRYYQQDLVRLQDDRTEWDLLTWLAREEGFDVFVKGKELHFEPKTPGKTRTFAFTGPTSSYGSPKFDGTSLSFSHNHNLAKDIVVEVRSWNPKQKKGFTKTAKATRQKSPVLKGGSAPVYDQQTYSYVVPNLTPEQAQSRANQLLRELSAHELKVHIAGPADNDLAIGDTIEVTGTGTAFDTVYYPDSIVREMSLEDGYRWSITGKNHVPESSPAI